MTIPTRVLTAWHRTCRAGHGLTPSQFLLLCDIIQHPTDVISYRQRGRRLSLTGPTIRDGHLHLKHCGLVTITTQKGTAQHHGRQYDTSCAHPTKAAYKLFSIRPPQ